jgi:hypothetical protein
MIYRITEWDHKNKVFILQIRENKVVNRVGVGYFFCVTGQFKSGQWWAVERRSLKIELVPKGAKNQEPEWFGL